jgi:hypothetical protein
MNQFGQIRNGRVRWLAKRDIIVQVAFISRLFGTVIAA